VLLSYRGGRSEGGGCVIGVEGGDKWSRGLCY